MELVVRTGEIDLPATLTLPEGAVRAGVVALHGAAYGERSYFLYEHLSSACAAADIAVLRYDRRPSSDGSDIDLQVQALDALAAHRVLAQHLPGVPIGLWGFSQGAWAAPLAATLDPEAVAFLICLSACGVSPAEQMRIGTAKQLRKAGYGAADLDELMTLRLAVENHLRGNGDRAGTQALLDVAAGRPWFGLVYLSPELPEPGGWADMDYDPEPVLARVSCPVLAFYGETDEWMPIEESVDAWHRAETEGDIVDLTVVSLAGADHLPTIGGGPDPMAISPTYESTLTDWITARVRTGSVP